LPMTEDLIPRPEDPYGIAKYAVEQDLAATKNLFGLDYVIFRPHNVYGENQNIGDPFRNVVGIFMKQILEGKKLTVFGDGTQSRSFSYIDDVAPIIARSAWEPKATGEIFNVGADQPYSVKELATLVARAMGIKPEIQYLPARMEVRHAYSDHGKVRKVFGVQKPVTLEKGLSRMAEWVKRTGIRESRELPLVEIWKKLPSNWRDVLLETGQVETHPHA